MPLPKACLYSRCCSSTPSGGIQSIVGGDGLSVDATDPQNPIVNYTGPITLEYQVLIPNADVLQLSTNPYVVVPAAGPGTVIVPMMFYIQIVGATVPFAATANTNFRYEDAANSIASLFIPWNTLQTIDRRVGTGSGGQIGAEFIENSGVVFRTSANPTVGDADLLITTYYIIHEKS